MIILYLATLDLAGVLEVGQVNFGLVKEGPEAAVIDNEAELRPICRRLDEVVRHLVFPYTSPTVGIIPRHEALVDAEVVDARLHGLLAERVHQPNAAPIPAVGNPSHRSELKSL